MDEHQLMSILSYLLDKENQVIYIISTSVDKSHNYRDRLCGLREIMDSFQLVN